MLMNYKDMVAYDGKTTSLTSTVDKISDVKEHIAILLSNRLPITLELNTAKDSSFRDAVLHGIVTYPSNLDAIQTLNVFVQAIRATSDEDTSLTMWCEYGASLAYAFGEEDLAKAIILRLSPTTRSSLIRNIAEGLINGMSASTFKELLTSSTAMSASLLS